MTAVGYNYPIIGAEHLTGVDASENALGRESTRVDGDRLPVKMPLLSRAQSFPGSGRANSFPDLGEDKSELFPGCFYDQSKIIGFDHADQDRKELPVAIQEDVSDLIDHRLDVRVESPSSTTSAALAPIRGQGLPPTLDLPKSCPEPSEITDLGHQRYNELKNENLVPYYPTDHDEFEDNLADRIFHASRRNARDRKDFLPKSQLDRLIHTSSVRLELRRRLSHLKEDTISAYANRICHGTAETFDKSTTEDLVKSYQKVFAVLVLVGRVDCIELFLRENVCDADLPLQEFFEDPDADSCTFELRRKKQPWNQLACFRSWSQLTLRNFEQYQWAMVPPFFSKGKRKNVQHYVLEQATVLPFTFTKNTNGNSKTREHRGGYSLVYQADIHPDHHNFNGPVSIVPDTSKPSQNTFAIKKLDSPSKEAFQKEVQILKRFSGDVHQHLISLLATFERDGTFYLIFPWAGADLKTYWKCENPRPVFNASTVTWMIEQCSGLADGLTRLHQYETGLKDQTEPPKNEYLAPNVVLNGGKDSGRPGPLYGRHGDIKPENILWFPNHTTPGHKGTLKISDFGLSELNSRSSKSKRRSHVPNSPTYRPPECDLRKKIIKQSYDIWTLGCLYLEFVAWILGGWDLVYEFECRRRSMGPGDDHYDCFFEIRDPESSAHLQAFVKPIVVEFVSDLHTHPRCSEFLHSFLEMIMTEMLIVESQANRRIGCMQLTQRLDVWHKRCDKDVNFMLKRSPWV